MTLQALDGGLYFPDPHFSASETAITEQGILIDAASEKAAMIFQAPATGSVDQVAFRVLAHTTAATLDVRVETIDLATGLPSGTLVGANTSGTVTTTGANTTHIVTLTAAASLTRGTFYALVVAQPSVSPGNCSIQYWDTRQNSSREGHGRHRLIYMLGFTTTWETKNGVGQAGRAPSMAIRYNDPKWRFIPGTICASSFSEFGFNSGSNPNERGAKIRFPFPARATGFFFLGSITDQDYQVILYDGTPTALQTFNGDKDVCVTYGTGPNYGGLHVGYFPATQSLAKDTDYFVMLKPTSTTNVGLDHITLLDTGTTAMMGMFNGGTNHILATRNGGAISTNATIRPLSMGLIIDAFDDAAGGGGGATSHIANLHRGLA